jgi:hypothetical protein
VPKLKLGAVVYGLVAISTGVEVVLMLRRDGLWRDVQGWELAALVAVVAASGLLLAVGAVTRRGLISDDGPWICRNGWIVMVALTAVAFVLVMLGKTAVPSWPTSPAVFLPHFIRKLQTSYYEGRAEATRDVREVTPGGERLPRL